MQPDKRYSETRYAVVRAERAEQIEAYLPRNYVVNPFRATSMPDGKTDFIIEGEDDAGWTLDEYVIPRLATGLYFAREYPTLMDAREAASAAMN